MSSLLSAELAATCSALGYHDEKSDKYYADSNTLETVKDLIRYLRRDDETHDVRRQLGDTNIVQTDLLPLLKSYWEETDLFDVLLRLLVNLTTPALMLWNEQPPADKSGRNHYLQIQDHLRKNKEAFADESVWAVLSSRISRILEIDPAERGDENSLIIERILILLRNILFVPPDPNLEKRPDNDASIHDQVLWALHQSGILDILLYMASSTNEKAYYMHMLEILYFMLREQRASDLAKAALQRSETEKIRDEAELLSIKHTETYKKQQKVKLYHGMRHSRFGGTYVVKTLKSISDNDFIYHKPLNKLDSLNFDVDKKKPKTPKNRLPVQGSTFERRSAFSIRLFLKEFCVEFLNGAYNTMMYHVKDSLARQRTQAHDESYYMWALRFFMEFNRCYKFQVKLVSETMSVQTFHYVQQQMEAYFDSITVDKKTCVLWSRRLHLALLAYRELLYTICAMDKSPEDEVRESAKVIKSNIFYILEYRELVLTLLVTFDELKMSNDYLRDLLETQHIFVKMLEAFCSRDGSVVVQTKAKRARKKKAAQNPVPTQQDLNLNLENRWDELAPQLTVVLEGGVIAGEDIVPFDAASDVPIDEQRSDAMINVQRKLRDGEFENAIGLLRAAREVWPENDCFGSNNMTLEEEFMALRDIFFAALGDDESAAPATLEQPIYDDNDEEEDDDGHVDYAEGNFNFKDFLKRLANPRIVRACGLALKTFAANSVHTNHCIVKLLHRIAFDCKMYVMVFQLSLLRSFQKIYASKEFPQYRELIQFATYIIRQFVKVTEINKKVYLEALFWKDSKEAYDIEQGYGSYQEKSIAAVKAWSEQEEDELRRLFMEHRENQLEEDVVDWIVNNLIDNTRSRRGILKKLKEMYLLTDYKGKGKPSGGAGAAQRAPRHWGAEEETQLRELFEQFRDAQDPMAGIMDGLDVPRPRNRVVEKLLVMGLIQDKKEVRKKAQKKTSKSRGRNDSDSGGSDHSDGGSSDDGQPSTSTTTTKNRKKKNPTQRTRAPKETQKTGGKARRKPSIQVSDEQLIRLLRKLLELGLNEAVEWLRDSFADAVEDFDVDAADDDSEGIPLVPIMDCAVDAMENGDFQRTLKALGVCEPFDEQETYWRIPSHFSLDMLTRTRDLLQSAVDNTLSLPAEESRADSKPEDRGASEAESSEDDVDFTRLRRQMAQPSSPDDDGGVENEDSNSRSIAEASAENGKSTASNGSTEENEGGGEGGDVDGEGSGGPIRKKRVAVLESSDESDGEEKREGSRSSDREENDRKSDSSESKRGRSSSESSNDGRGGEERKDSRSSDREGDDRKSDSSEPKRGRSDSESSTNSDIGKPTAKRAKFIESDSE